MDREAWTDSAVAVTVAEGFVPIRVDGDRRPDIADRYLAGGWPTTAILTTDGQVMAAQTVVGAAPLRQMLAYIRDLYAKNRGEVDRKAEESARRVAATWTDEATGAPEMPLAEWIDRNLAAVREAEDREHGGLQGSPKLPHYDGIQLLLDASAARRDPSLRALALRMLDGSLRLEDSVWGGFFRFAIEPDWKRPRTEKLLDANARALAALVRATELSGGSRYREAARRTEAYAARWLWDSRQGGWFGSQDADVIVGARRSSRGDSPPEEAGRLISGDVYYGLSDRARRAQGVPRIDSTLYSDANARMASAVLRGARAGIWKGAPVQRAVRALDRLWQARRAPDGSLYHAWTNGVGSLPGLLADQAAAGIAYLDAYEATRDSRHLERAEALASWIRQHLEDPRGGGFRYAVRDPAAIGRLAAGEKPEPANIEAGWLFLRLASIRGRSEDRRSAERTLDHLRSGDQLVLDPARARLGIAIEAGAGTSKTP